MIDVSADLGPMAEAAGIIEGISVGIESDIYLNNFVNYSLDVLREKFNTEFTLTAKTNQDRYHHVFEWGTLTNGAPIPLFKLYKTGRGRNRMLNYTFLQSRRAVPKPRGTSVPAGKFRSHVFRFKALVMEEGKPITISKLQGAKFLFIPVNFNKRGYILLPQAALDKKPVTIKNPGGEATTHAFANFWNNWFLTRGKDITRDEIQPYAEKNILLESEKQLRTIRRGSNVSTKTFVPFAETAAAAMERAKKQTEINAEKYFAGRFDDEDDEDY